jgi:hypothetical protein
MKHTDYDSSPRGFYDEKSARRWARTNLSEIRIMIVQSKHPAARFIVWIDDPDAMVRHWEHVLFRGTGASA